jgi:hypothetical protein
MWRENGVWVKRLTMPTCFVIQPFDRNKYDKRFEDVYSPAILDAGLEPYRVDKDPSVDVPIDAIEEVFAGRRCALRISRPIIPMSGMSWDLLSPPGDRSF